MAWVAKKGSGNGPFPRWGGSVTKIDDGQVFFFGGADSARTYSDIYVLHTRTDLRFGKQLNDMQ
jgi:galactose oxidase-like protein